jgi:uncharacterized 2Fe-2S/4Fe-4S cluster protein (DUF4445 family)
MNIEKVTVQFLPANRTLEETKGSNLLAIAMEAGIYINAACGGVGACGRCQVLIKSGDVECKDCSKVPPENYAKGYRLACQSYVHSTATIVVPPELHPAEATAGAAAQYKPAHRQIVLQDLERLVSGAWHNPALRKFTVTLDPPSISDNISDLSRLLRALKKQHNLENISIDFSLLKKLPQILREAHWDVTVTIVQTRMESQLGEHQLRGSRRPKMISVEAGNTIDKHYSIVLDIGTTSLWGQLVDLNSGESLAEASEYNPQIRFGDDVITRIIHSQRNSGLQQLQEAVVGGLNTIIHELITKTGVEKQQVSHLTAAGNTTMIHLLAGLDPKFIREAPYTPVANFIPPIRALRLGLDVNEHVYIYTFPSVASYVGGDIVSGVLGSGMYQRKELTLYIDIGTNGEIVVGNQDWLMTASCSAGPAFEGGGLTCGMRAMSGAIEGFKMHPETFEPMLLTIGKIKPVGICGSGAINILAEFLLNGVIDQNGKFNHNCRTKRLREGTAGMEYVFAYKEDTGLDRDIIMNEADIDNLIRAKAAMYAGYQSLLGKAGLTFQILERVIIAGAFGDFINLENAITIGLLPDLPLERYTFIGNGSLLGAKLISVSNELLDDAERIARKMTNIELSEDHSFMENYIAGMFLPHTDASLFPEVMSRIASHKRCDCN